jgi:CRP/FNR family transcriptional regulator, cyclic AMP receptor protein
VADDGKLSFDPGALFTDANGAATVRCGKDQVLFAQGDLADSVFYIQEGTFKVAVLSEQGKEAVVAMLGAGDFCGEGCLGGQSARMASVVAMTDCVAVRME